MKGITDIDECAALLLVRAYKAAYQSEGPRIRSEVWTTIAQQLNKQNTKNLTVTQWKKRISNIKSLVKLKSDMERRGRIVNWTSIEREYLRLFPNLLSLDDDNSSLSGGPHSTTNPFSLDEEQALVDQDLDEMDETPSMVKTETPKWANDDFRRSLLEAHKQFLMAASSATAATSTSSNPANSSSSTVNSTPTSTSEQSTSSLLATSSSASAVSMDFPLPPLNSLPPPQQSFSTQVPIVNLRSIVAQMDAQQRKKSMLMCLANFRQQIDLFSELLEQDLGMTGPSF